MLGGRGIAVPGFPGRLNRYLCRGVVHVCFAGYLNNWCTPRPRPHAMPVAQPAIYARDPECRGGPEAELAGILREVRADATVADSCRGVTEVISTPVAAVVVASR